MSTTRRTRTTATASGHACAESAGMHDADTCRRIRDLEQKVAQLEHQGCHHHHCDHYHWYPWYGTSINTWSTSISGSTSLGQISDSYTLR